MVLFGMGRGGIDLLWLLGKEGCFVGVVNRINFGRSSNFELCVLYMRI